MIPQHQPSLTLCPSDDWQKHQPSVIPEGWSSCWPRTRFWSSFLGYIGSLAWNLEHAYHYLGTAIPLLYRYEFLLFKCGGLFFLYWDEDADIFIVELGLAEILARLGPDLEDLWTVLPLRKITFEQTAVKPPSRFRALWRWERREYGRNRWEEYEARGGKLEDSWWTVAPIPEHDYDIYM